MTLALEIIRLNVCLVKFVQIKLYHFKVVSFAPDVSKKEWKE